MQAWSPVLFSMKCLKRANSRKFSHAQCHILFHLVLNFEGTIITVTSHNGANDVIDAPFSLKMMSPSDETF